MKQLLISLLFLLATPVFAQDSDMMAQPGETYGEWINRLVAVGTQSEKDTTIATEATKAADVATPAAAERVLDKAVPEGSPETQGSLRDFLPFFFGSLGLGDVKDENGALTLTFNPELLQMGPKNPLSLQTVIRDPVIFDALIKAIPESIRADRKSALEEQLESFGDVEVNLSWSRESERFGRNPKDHNKLMGDLFEDVTKEAAKKVGTTATKNLLNVFADRRLPDDALSKTPDETDDKVSDLLEPTILAAAQEIVERQKVFTDLLKNKRWYELDDLVNNQPQILASATYRQRDDLIGPDEWTAKFSYEMGFANINGLKRYCEDKGKSEPDSDCLEGFLTEVGKTTEFAPRLKIEGEFGETAQYFYGLPADSFSYGLDRIQKTVIKGSLGGYMHSNAQGNQTTRVDLEGLFEDVTGDEKRNNRFVATLTFSQKMTGDMSAAFSVVYANKPEYLGEVDEELGARVGLRYKIDKGD
jgi:hypothetical protein